MQDLKTFIVDYSRLMYNTLRMCGQDNKASLPMVKEVKCNQIW